MSERLALPARNSSVQDESGGRITLPTRRAEGEGGGNKAEEIARLQAELEAVRYNKPVPEPEPELELLPRKEVRSPGDATYDLPARSRTTSSKPRSQPQPEPELQLLAGPQQEIGSPDDATYDLPARNRTASSKPRSQPQPQLDEWSGSEQDALELDSARPVLPTKGGKFAGFRPEQSKAIFTAVLERPGTALGEAKQQNSAQSEKTVVQHDPMAQELPRIVLADAIKDAVQKCHKTPEDQEFMLQLCGDGAPTLCTCVCEELDLQQEEEHPFSMRKIAIAIKRELQLSAVAETEIAEQARVKLTQELQRFDLKTLTGYDVGGPHGRQGRDFSETPKTLVSDILYLLRTRAWEETAPGSKMWKYKHGVASVVKCPLDTELYKKWHKIRKVKVNLEPGDEELLKQRIVRRIMYSVTGDEDEGANGGDDTDPVGDINQPEALSEQKQTAGGEDTYLEDPKVKLARHLRGFWYMLHPVCGRSARSCVCPEGRTGTSELRNCWRQMLKRRCDCNPWEGRMHGQVRLLMQYEARLIEAQAKERYFDYVASKQKDLLAAQVNGSHKLQQQYQKKEEYFSRRAADARVTIAKARSAISQTDRNHAKAVHVLEQGLCSTCKVADGSWEPKTALWDDQVWTYATGKPSGYYSYTYKESEIDKALDIYWVRVLAERIRAKMQRERAGTKDVKSFKVLDLPESWPLQVPDEELDPKDYIGSETRKQLNSTADDENGDNRGTAKTLQEWWDGVSDSLLPQLTTRSYCYQEVPDQIVQGDDGKPRSTKNDGHGGHADYHQEEYVLRRRLVEEARQRVKLEDFLTQQVEEAAELSGQTFTKERAFSVLRAAESMHPLPRSGKTGHRHYRLYYQKRFSNEGQSGWFSCMGR